MHSLYNLFLSIFCLVTFTYVSRAQSAGLLKFDRNSQEKVIRYEPPMRLKLPDSIFAVIVYSYRSEYYFKKIAITGINNKFEFRLTVPDSVRALVLAIADHNLSIVDNNSDTGFVIYTQPKLNSGEARLDAMYLLSYYAIRPLKLNYQKLKPVMVNLFKEAYSLSPKLDQNNPYHKFYLKLLYEIEGNKVKDRLEKYAKKKLKSDKSEGNFLEAINVYETLGNSEELERIRSKAIKKFPIGKIAAESYIQKMQMTDTTEAMILKSFVEYKNAFRDSSEQVQYTFYRRILGVLIERKQWNRIIFYEPYMPSKINLASMYNYIALNITSKTPVETNDLSIAKYFIQKSLFWIDSMQVELREKEDNGGDLTRLHYKYSDTYSQVLYKLEKYDSAFQIKDQACQNNFNLEASDIESLVKYAEKAKGDEFAYNVLTKYLAKEISSPVLIENLTRLATKMRLPEPEHQMMIERAISLDTKRTQREVERLYGSGEQIKFNLKNIKGENVALAAFVGKIVILDFWATWCLPCIESFPKMKEVMEYFKNTPDVVFLFINTWEKGTEIEIADKVNRFIKNGRYDFEVLIDANDAIATLFRVNSIPTRIIINKSGKIVSLGNTSNLILEIESFRNPKEK